MRIPLKDIIENNDTRWGRVFDLAIQTLIVVSLVSFSVETLPDLNATTQSLLHYLETMAEGDAVTAQ